MRFASFVWKYASRTKKSGTSIKRLFVKEIFCDLAPDEAHARLSCEGGPSALLESARVSERLGRWSIAAARPVERFTFYRGRGNPFSGLSRLMKDWRTPGDPRTPFTGGAIGYFSYECASYVEPKCAVAHPPGQFPAVDFLFFDRAVVFDHVLNKTYLVFCAERSAATRSAERVFDSLRRRLDAQRTGWVARRKSLSCLPLTTTLNRLQFVDRVRRIQNHIAKGDVFQANLTQQIHFGAPQDLHALYRRLKRLNPSPFFGMLNTGREQILSGSPERLLRLEGRRLDTRPIAGTRPRGTTQAATQSFSRELFLSPKERAEHVMLVDLERNDLGRVCEPGSVRVDEFMEREEYSHVQHIVSNIEGRLREGFSGVEALEAFFPGGTITGAPKVRAMEIIRMLEPAPRGPYTGSLGYFSFSGGMDFNILIRSLFVRNGRAYLGAGAGIVADSDPDKEYDETLHKAEAVLHAACGSGIARRYLHAAGISQSFDSVRSR